MNKLKNYVIILLFFVLVVFGILFAIEYSQLKKENLQLKLEYANKIDSIRVENEILTKEIYLLNHELEFSSQKIDSLKKIKQQIIVKTEYIVSENITESVALLKNNLKCERY